MKARPVRRLRVRVIIAVVGALTVLAILFLPANQNPTGLGALGRYQPRRFDLLENFYCLIIPEDYASEARRTLKTELPKNGWALAPTVLSGPGARLEYNKGTEKVIFSDEPPAGQTAVLGEEITIFAPGTRNPRSGVKANDGELMVQVRHDVGWLGRQMYTVRKFLGIR